MKKLALLFVLLLSWSGSACSAPYTLVWSPVPEATYYIVCINPVSETCDRKAYTELPKFDFEMTDYSSTGTISLKVQAVMFLYNPSQAIYSPYSETASCNNGLCQPTFQCTP